MFSRSDDHGIADLLRQVAERNDTSLTEEERKEVSAMVKRVEEKTTPMGRMKKKMKDNIHNVAGTIQEVSGHHHGSDDNDSVTSSGSHASFTSASHSSSNADAPTPGSPNKWGKDLVQKFSNLQTSIPSLPKNPLNKDNIETKPKPEIKEVFRSFSEKIKTSTTKTPATTTTKTPATTKSSATATTDGATSSSSTEKPGRIKAEHVKEVLRQESEYLKAEAQLLKEETKRLKQETQIKIKKEMEKAKAEAEKAKVEIRNAFRRSSQNGRELLTRFGSSINRLVDSRKHPEYPVAEYDINSPEYQKDLQAIKLLKEIFPEESTEALIKMHFDSLNKPPPANGSDGAKK